MTQNLLWGELKLRWLSGEEPIYQCRSCRRGGFNPWVGKIPWRRKWPPSSILPGIIPRAEEPGRLQSMGSQNVRHSLVTLQAVCCMLITCFVLQDVPIYHYLLFLYLLAFILLEYNCFTRLYEFLLYKEVTLLCVCAELLQLCPTLCDAMDCGLPGSSVHGILQVRILECQEGGNICIPMADSC